MLILASASARRHDLLCAAGLDHVVRPTSVPEVRRPGEAPMDFVQRLAFEKAEAASRELADIVLAADTIVCLGSEVLEKPKDDDDACRMLRLLSGNRHRVYTGICLLKGVSCLLDLAATEVSFAELTESEILDYTRSGEPAGKAGAYAIQGLASKFVVSVEGSYQNVVGLPISLVYRHLKTLTL
jgi:septum formation protein